MSRRVVLRLLSGLRRIEGLSDSLTFAALIVDTDGSQAKLERVEKRYVLYAEVVDHLPDPDVA